MCDYPETVAAYPLVLTRLVHARCIVIGGGAVAERKVTELLAGGAAPHIISPELTAKLEQLAQAGAIVVTRRSYATGDLQGALLAFAATNNRRVNSAVAEEARHMGVLVNVADDPAACDFHTVATVRRGDLLLTVSTNGASPTLAAHIRRELAARYGPEYANLLALFQRLRAGAAQALVPASRAVLWRRLLDKRVRRWLRAGDHEQVEHYAQLQIMELQDHARARYIAPPHNDITA